jgi:hypothetical protein
LPYIGVTADAEVAAGAGVGVAAGAVAAAFDTPGVTKSATAEHDASAKPFIDRRKFVLKAIVPTPTYCWLQLQFAWDAFHVRSKAR